MTTDIRIGIIGDFHAENPTHIATTDSIQHAAKILGKRFEAVWLATDQPHEFRMFHGLLCSPGSPYRSLNGALAAIRYARENNIPFLGACGGFQHAVIEYARNVMGFTDAAHAESDPYASCLFISALNCSLVGKTLEVTLKPGSKAAPGLSVPSIYRSVLLQFWVESGIPEAAGEEWPGDYGQRSEQ